MGMKTMTQFKFDTRPLTNPGDFHQQEKHFKLKPTSFQLKRMPFWRILFTLAGLVILSFLTGYPWAGLLAAIGYGFLLEKALVNNAYFGGLDNRIFTDDAGKSWLEVTRKQTMDKFLDTELRLTVTDVNLPFFTGYSQVLFEETIIPRAVARRRGDRYLIPLPLPPATVPPSDPNSEEDGVIWELRWRCARSFALHLDYSVAVWEADR
jgi:hypothetical protein